ncbi:hypothetical protein QYE76_046668 [Lolium multiflorum]|uniref:Cullin N-terminal domain-containing protein n=1 Tax=Lolium multiflorum TaxID=4521 RepID=A0AAD8TMG5_LOLMU|nr:hypothetical protein QYE76_046668 [Lolium multiflorum]
MSARHQFSAAAFRWQETDGNPDVVAGNCKAVTNAVRDIYAQDMTNVIFGDLYRRAYSLVLHKRGEELYSAVEAAMASEVQALVGSLAVAGPSGQSFLRELLATWRRHTAAVSAIRDIVMYMDRTFVPATGRTPVRELGLGLWRDGVVRSGRIRLRLVEAVRLEKARQEEDGVVGVPGSGDLVAGVTEMLTELGADVCHEFMEAPTVSS